MFSDCSLLTRCRICVVVRARRTSARVGAISRSATIWRRPSTPSFRRFSTPTTHARPAGRAACRHGSVPSRSCTSTIRAPSRTSTSTTVWSSPSAAVDEPNDTTQHKLSSAPSRRSPCLHRHNFTLKSGGDQWRRQDLVSGGTTIEAPKARASTRQRRRVGSPPQPTMGLGECRELPQRGPGRSPGRYRIFCMF